MNIAVLGTGLVGSDLLDKVIRSPYLDCVMFAGIRKESPGIQRAMKMRIPVSVDSVDGVLNSKAMIVFDCTTAKAHIKHAPLLKDKFVIDLTPSRVGKMCVPDINLDEIMEKGLCMSGIVNEMILKETNVNLVTCGIQAMGKIAKDVMDKHHPEYLELVSTISSSSAGMGTRNNIDEFTQTTEDALKELTGVKRAKAIIVINPADIHMRNTLTWEVDGKRDQITRIVKTEGKLAGNLDIINKAAITIAEAYAI